MGKITNMRVTVTTLDFDTSELAVVRQALGLDVIAADITSIRERLDLMSADFTALNAAIGEHNTTVTELAAELDAALGRIEADVQTLVAAASDEADQAAVNTAAESLTASTAAVRASVDRLKAVDPLPPVEPDPEPTDPTEPTEPTDPAEPTEPTGPTDPPVDEPTR